MRALVFDGQLRLEQEMASSQPHPGEVVIRPTMMGVCNTDLEIVQGYMGYKGVLGHEFVGVVEAANNQALIGRRVCGDINAACGTCKTCLAGHSHHCPNRTVLGIFNRNGAFADFLTLPEANLYVVPDTVPDTAAVFVEPLAAAFEIAEQVTIAKTDVVVVLGDGKLGLLIAQTLRLFSDNVLLLGRHKEKMAIAEKQGVSVAMSDDYNQPMSAKLVVDATGSSAGLEKAISLCQPLGTVVLKSTVASKYQVDLSPLVIHEITLLGSRCGPFDKALAALEKNQVDVESLISETYALNDGVKAVERAAQKGVMKVLMTP